MFGHLTYLILEVAWGVPVLILQIAFGWPLLWRHRGVWWLAGALCTLYLSMADDVAIHAGIWLINPARTTGARIIGLPLEEMIFFGITSLMVVQTVVIVNSPARDTVIARWGARLSWLRHLIERMDRQGGQSTVETRRSADVPRK